MNMDLTLPLARRDDLLVEELGDELIVFDQQRNEVHSLNKGAALVWRLCDGHTPVAAMAASLSTEHGALSEEEVVRLALKRLDRAGLLKRSLSRVGTSVGSSRREVG